MTDLLLEGYNPAVELSRLSVWEGNPRKTVNQAKIDELARSIRTIGLQQPVVVNRRGEVIAGQRRYLAAQQEGLDTIPCVVRDLDDEEALEVAIAENASRVDVSPIEEAEAIDAYLRSGRSIEQAADRFGRTAAWITGRTRLLALTPAWRTCVADERCPIRHAELLSRLAIPVQNALAARYSGRDLPTFYEFERAVQLVLHRLAEAPFPLGDDTYPRGSCDGCPSRSDKQRDLFSAEATDDDASCLDPTCWAAKVEHRWTVAQKDAKRRKLRVLSADEAKLFDCGIASHSSEWVELERGAKEGLAPTAIARTDDGLVVELVSRRAYVEACEARRLRIKTELEAQAAERGAAKRAARTDEPADVATAPTIPPSALVNEDESEDEELTAPEPNAEEIARLEADANLLAVALVSLDRDQVDDTRSALVRFCGIGRKPGVQAAIVAALIGEGKSWEDLADSTGSMLHTALLMDAVLSQAQPGEVSEILGGVSPALAARVQAAQDPSITRMVARFEAELDAARTVDDLTAAWAAIMSEDHRPSLPALATRWLARATALGVKPTTLKNLRKRGQAPAPELTKEAA